MKLIIQKWGNSAAIILPDSILEQIGAKVGDSVEIEPESLKLIKPKYKLSDLIALCNKDAPYSQDAKLWNDAKSIGTEII